MWEFSRAVKGIVDAREKRLEEAERTADFGDKGVRMQWALWVLHKSVCMGQEKS